MSEGVLIPESGLSLLEVNESEKYVWPRYALVTPQKLAEYEKAGAKVVGKLKDSTLILVDKGEPTPPVEAKPTQAPKPTRRSIVEE